MLQPWTNFRKTFNEVFTTYKNRIVQANTIEYSKLYFIFTIRASLTTSAQILRQFIKNSMKQENLIEKLLQKKCFDKSEKDKS